MTRVTHNVHLDLCSIPKVSGGLNVSSGFRFSNSNNNHPMRLGLTLASTVVPFTCIAWLLISYSDYLYGTLSSVCSIKFRRLLSRVVGIVLGDSLVGSDRIELSSPLNLRTCCYHIKWKTYYEEKVKRLWTGHQTICCKKCILILSIEWILPHPPSLLHISPYSSRNHLSCNIHFAIYL
jgi:hypothetical protein